MSIWNEGPRPPFIVDSDELLIYASERTLSQGIEAADFDTVRACWDSTGRRVHLRVVSPPVDRSRHWLFRVQPADMVVFANCEPLPEPDMLRARLVRYLVDSAQEDPPRDASLAELILAVLVISGFS